MEFQSELDLPRPLGAIQQAHGSAQPRVRRVQNRRVCEVDELRSKLNLKPLGNVEEFCKAQVQRVQSGTTNCATD